MADRSTAQAAVPAQAPDGALAEIEAMLLRLEELRKRESSKDRRSDYTAAIDRLHALAYRLAEAGTSRTVGLPKPPAPAPAAPVPKAPQPALPLGRARPCLARAVIVRARKPKPR